VGVDYYITGYVYFVQAGDDQAVKIGSTVELDKRLLALQTSNHRRLRLIGAIDLRKSGFPENLNRVEFGKIAREREAEIQERFAGDRIHGDWFKLSTSLASFIAEVSNVEAAA
jgi:hypothetical protein